MTNNKTHIVVDVSKYPEDTTRFQLPSLHLHNISKTMEATDEPVHFKVEKRMQASVAQELRNEGFEVAIGVGMFSNKITVFPKKG